MVYGYHRASGCVVHFLRDRVSIDDPGNEVSDQAIRPSDRANDPEVLIQCNHASRSSDKDRAVSENGGRRNEEVVRNRCRQAVDGCDRVVPAILCLVPKAYSTVSGNQDMLTELNEVSYYVAGQSRQQATLAPRSRARIEGLETSRAAVPAHQAHKHLLSIHEKPVHLIVERWGRWLV